MAKTLREQLIGAWMLHAYVETSIDNGAISYPLGEQPQGIIMYTSEGYMSAQLMKPGRKAFAVNDFFYGTQEEYQAAASTYIAYSGPFHVDEMKRTLTHTMLISLLPNWTGQTQPRSIHLEGGVLTLGTEQPISSRGKMVNARLVWHRAKTE